MSQKIAVFSLSTTTPFFITGIYNDNTLIMSVPKSLPNSLKKQREKVIPAVQKLRNSGFKVLVEETSGTIASECGAHHVSLNTRHTDGRAAVLVGIERYNELRLQKAILLPEKNPGAYEIPSSIVDVDYNAAGDVVYHINWQDIRPEHRLTILCCFSTVYHPVTSADYINAMTGGGEEREANPFFRTFANLIRHQDVTSANAVPASLSGNRVSENEVIL
ncbi:maturation control protein [Citrobacter sp. NCU1]|uniref:maturation control protein n=1 Tax=Citrobacter sp. NCU1 TaxID=2026683 RepID=UPI001877D815|nr:maturation control protein [Citrobacter sp. NCU1]